MSALRVAAWPDDLDQHQLVAADRHLAGRDDMVIGEALDEDVDQGELVVAVQEIRQAGAGEGDPAGQDAVVGIGEQVDERLGGRRSFDDRPRRKLAPGAARRREHQARDATQHERLAIDCVGSRRGGGPKSCPPSHL